MTVYNPETGKTVTSATTVYRLGHDEDEPTSYQSTGYSQNPFLNRATPLQAEPIYREQVKLSSEPNYSIPSSGQVAQFAQNNVLQRPLNLNTTHQYKPILPPTEIVTTIEEGDKTKQHTAEVIAFAGLNNSIIEGAEGQIASQNSRRSSNLSLASAFRTHQLSAAPYMAPKSQLRCLELRPSGHMENPTQAKPWEVKAEPSKDTTPQSSFHLQADRRASNPLAKTPFK